MSSQRYNMCGKESEDIKFCFCSAFRFGSLLAKLVVFGFLTWRCLFKRCFHGSIEEIEGRIIGNHSS